VIDPEEYLLIGATRLEDVPLQVVADRLGISVPLAAAWRRRAERRLPAAIADGELDRVSLVEAAARRRSALTHQAAQALLSGTDTEFIDSMDVTGDQGHGRTERRTMRVAPCDDSLFPGARQVFRLRRDTGGLEGVRTSKEIIHGIVSLNADLASPQHLNHYARGHWVVENRLHWTRDVTFHEDDSQLRTGTAPRAMASFRNLSLNTFRLAGRANIAHARRDLHDRTDTFAVYGI
jgi:hypothetical protein